MTDPGQPAVQAGMDGSTRGDRNWGIPQGASKQCLEDPCGSPQLNKQYWIPIKNSLTLEILNYGQECPVTLVWLYTISKHPIFTKVLTHLMLETENSGCRDTTSADALAPKVARASAGMILAVQDRRLIVPGVISTICVKPNPRYNPNVNISFAISSTHWNKSQEIIYFFVQVRESLWPSLSTSILSKPCYLHPSRRP